MIHADVAVVGGGPVGLLLGCRLSQLGVSVVVLERSAAPESHSRAIGIHAPSLELLDELGLVDGFLGRGLRVPGGVAVGRRRVLGELSFDDCPGPYNFALSLPQDETERLLESGLRASGEGSLRRGVSAHGVRLLSDGLQVDARDKDAPLQVRCSYLVGCDGKQSMVRQAAGISFSGDAYQDRFLMGDFDDNTPFGAWARIFITRAGLVESFPLPGGRRRWVVSSGGRSLEPTREALEQEVARRAGHDLRGQPCHMLSPFGIQRFLADKLYSGRMAIAGDAAQVMSPIGGQGMNTGWLNARDLANALAGIVRRGEQPDAALSRYQDMALRRSRAAIRRAELNTRLGRGTPATALRNALIWAALHIPPARRSMARAFSMRGL